LNDYDSKTESVEYNPSSIEAEYMRWTEKDDEEEDMQTISTSPMPVQPRAFAEEIFGNYCRDQPYLGQSTLEVENIILLTLPGVAGLLPFMGSLFTAIDHANLSCNARLMSLLERFLGNFITYYTTDPVFSIRAALVISPEQIRPTLAKFRDFYSDQNDIDTINFEGLSLSSPRGLERLFGLSPSKLAKILTMFYIKGLEEISPGQLIKYLVGGSDIANPLSRIYSYTNSLTHALAESILVAPTHKVVRKRVNQLMKIAEIFATADDLELLYMVTSIFEVGSMKSLLSFSERQKTALKAYQTRISFASNYKIARNIMDAGRYRIPFLQIVGRDMTYIKDLPLKDDEGRYWLDALKSIAEIVLTVFHGSADFERKVLGRRYTGGFTERSEKIYSAHRSLLMAIPERYGQEDWTSSIQDSIRIRLGK
jgi:hypothetical protein